MTIAQKADAKFDIKAATQLTVTISDNPAPAITGFTVGLNPAVDGLTAAEFS
ncbi:MAG: hypothetical protein ACOYIB_02490 [Desulfosporosinus sp.]